MVLSVQFWRLGRPSMGTNKQTALLPTVNQAITDGAVFGVSYSLLSPQENAL
ncbi:serine hydrolase, partial [Lacticaseibacillus paracasei]